MEDADAKEKESADREESKHSERTGWRDEPVRHLRELRNRILVCIVILVVRIGLHYAPISYQIFLQMGKDLDYELYTLRRRN
ncbi:MAG: hypothetical protein V8S36_01965 [Lachnospiraceae bacterium]